MSKNLPVKQKTPEEKIKIANTGFSSSFVIERGSRELEKIKGGDPIDTKSYLFKAMSLHEFNKGVLLCTSSDFWTKGPIGRILSCETYVSGKAYYNKYEAVVARHPVKDQKYKKVKKTSRRERSREDWIAFDVPVIIDDYGLFEKIQKRLEYNRKYACKKKKYDYLLSGLIYCGCGNRRVGDGVSKDGHHYYRCIERLKTRPYPARCNIGGVNASIVDSFLWRELKKQIFSYTIMKKYAERWLNSLSILDQEDLLEKHRLEELVIKTSEEESRYSRAYGAGTLDYEQFEDLMKDVKKRKESYQKQINELAKKKAEIAVEIEVDELLTEVLNIVKNIDFSNQFKVIRDIIDKVIVTERNGIEVWAHLPLSSLITEKLGYEPERRNCGAS